MSKWENAPPWFISLADNTIMIDSMLNLNISEQRERYAIRGVIYGGDEHFTSRISKENGEMWYHDGIEIGRKPNLKVPFILRARPF